ncbi:uncharacterized protein [Branchiostoma lanceolatum]|uniref:uncharacterized protein n=1 Tax=Branchiostoma lanceolatum TaxID=7740 RepID=UPI003451DE86
MLSKSSKLIRSSQGATLSTMEILNKAVAHTVSCLIQMLPAGNSTLLDTTLSLFENDVVNVNLFDVSPKQQLKNIKDQQWKYVQQLRKAGLSLVEAMELTADSLLAMLPDTGDYTKIFESDDVIVTVKKATGKNTLALHGGQVNVSGSPTNCAADGDTDAKSLLLVYRLHLYPPITHFRHQQRTALFGITLQRSGKTETVGST